MEGTGAVVTQYAAAWRDRSDTTRLRRRDGAGSVALEETSGRQENANRCTECMEIDVARDNVQTRCSAEGVVSFQYECQK